MSAAKEKKEPSEKGEKTYLLTGPWAGAWKIFAGIGALGVVGAGIGYTQDPRRFAFSWLFAFITVLTVALGALFFVLIQRLTSAGWSVTVRRTAEFFAIGVVACLPLFLPVVVSMNQLFPWLGHHAAAGEEKGEHPTEHKVGQKSQGDDSSFSLEKTAFAQEHADPPADPHAAAPPGAIPPGHPGMPPEGRPGEGRPGMPPGMRPGMPGGRHPGEAMPPGMMPGMHQPMAHGASHGDPHALIEKEILEKKAPFLNRNFFIARVVIYFLIWMFLSTRLFKLSTDQDKSKDPKLTLQAQALAPPGTFLFALTLTGAAVDWIMSLEPTWFSTIFGVVIFACGVVSSYAVIILTTMALKQSGPLEGAVTVEHFHDLGKLQFGFLVFWAYVSFSQYMLIWYAALPEETTFFHNRWDFDPWSNVSLAIILFHFVVPFFWTISRNFKRNLGRLQIGSVIILVMHVVDIYWFVMPNFHLGKPGFAFHWMDAACLLACVGVYGAYVFHQMTKFPLVPVGDPRLERALHFQNA